MKHNNQLFLEGTNGKAVLLIHGITSGASQMVPMAQFLNDYGYSVHSVNLAGHGTYPDDLLHTGCREFIKKAEYDYSQLKKEYDTVFVGGLSTGGCLSLYLAAKHPEIAGIIPISSPLFLDENCFIAQKYPEDMVYFHRSMEGKYGIAKKYHVHYEDIPVVIFKALYDLMDILKKDDFLKQVKCPAFIVQTKDDAVSVPKSGEIIYDSISSEVKELYMPETGTHNVVLTERRLDVFRKTVEFLENIK